MPTYNYLARTAEGRMERGTLEAGSPGAAQNSLVGRGLRPVRIQTVSAGNTGRLAELGNWNPLRLLPPRSLDVEIALAQLSVMLHGGLTLLTALRTTAEQATRYSLRRILNAVADRIQDGGSFAEALAEHRCFPPLVVQLAKVGEQTGNLDLVLQRAGKQLEERRLVVTNLLTALAYPLIVCVAAIGVSVYLIAYVIPKLQKFLTALGRQLPPMTQLLLDISDFVQLYGLTIVVGIVFAILAFILTYNWPPGRLWIDRWALRVPIIGYVLRLAGTAVFASALAVLIRSGITVLDALRTTEQLHRNQFLAQCVANARDAVIQGESLSRPLGVPFAYLPMLSKMVAVAENTGELDEILEHVARFHEEQLQVAIRRLSAFIEPAIILVVGGIVGFVYISFFVALFSVGG